MDALNVALRAALTRFYPEIEDITLTDYCVRILIKQATRHDGVLIESGDGHSQWGRSAFRKTSLKPPAGSLDSVEHSCMRSPPRRNSMEHGKTSIKLFWEPWPLIIFR